MERRSHGVGPQTDAAVDEERSALIARLVDALDQVSQRGTPQLVTVEAARGRDVSSVLPELLERLMATSPGAASWPAVIGTSTATPPVSFRPPPGSEPSWVWWSTSAARWSSAPLADILADELHHLASLAEPLNRRWRQLGGGPDWYDPMDREDGLLGWARSLTDDRQRRWGSPLGTPSELDVVAGRDLIDELAGSLAWFARAGLPFVIAVDDVHEADQRLVALLVRLLEERHGPLLIVVTALPGTLDQHGRPAYRLVRDVATPLRTRLRVDAAGHPGGSVSDVSASDELRLEIEVVSSELERLAADEHDRLVRELSDELALVDVGTSPQRRRQQALRLTALASQGHLGWSAPVVDAAGRLLAEAATSTDRVSLQTVLTLGAMVPDLGDAASRSRRELVASACSALGQHQRSIELLTELVSEHTAANGPDHERTLAVRSHLADQLRKAWRLKDARICWSALLADQLRVLGPDDPRTLASRRGLADIHREATAVYIPGEERLLAILGDLPPDADPYASLVADQVRLLGPDHPEVLDERLNHAEALGAYDDEIEAAAAMRSLMVDTVRIFGLDHPRTLRTRNSLISALVAVADVEGVFEQLHLLIEERTRLVGAWHPSTLDARRDLAWLLGSLGRSSDAVLELTSQLTELIEAFGPDHPRTLGTRIDRAIWFAEMGEDREAIDELQLLIADHARVFGEDHPATLAVRCEHVTRVVEDDRFPEVVELMQPVVDDHVRALGPEHRRTWIARELQAMWLALHGSESEAVRIFDELLAWIEPQLGPDHPDARYVRELRWLTERGSFIIPGWSGELTVAPPGRVGQPWEVITS